MPTIIPAVLIVHLFISPWMGCKVSRYRVTRATRVTRARKVIANARKVLESARKVLENARKALENARKVLERC